MTFSVLNSMLGSKCFSMLLVFAPLHDITALLLLLLLLLLLIIIIIIIIINLIYIAPFRVRKDT